jgi:transcriptional regulator with XRE-family HTH domain
MKDNKVPDAKTADAKAESKKAFAYEVSERIKSLSKLKGLAVSNALVECGHNAGFVTAMTIRGSVPSADAFIPIADYFNVSLDYLFGRPPRDLEYAELLLDFEEMAKSEGLSDKSISREHREAYFGMLKTATALFLKTIGIGGDEADE